MPSYRDLIATACLGVMVYVLVNQRRPIPYIIVTEQTERNQDQDDG